MNTAVRLAAITLCLVAGCSKAKTTGNSLSPVFNGLELKTVVDRSTPSGVLWDGPQVAPMENSKFFASFTNCPDDKVDSFLQTLRSEFVSTIEKSGGKAT